MAFDPREVRKDFPIFERTIRDGKRLVYLDSGATSQKPNSVIEAESNFYRKHNAAVHRGAHQLAEEATDAYEGARTTVAKFLGGSADEIIFTKSATESLNLLAYAFSNAENGNRFAIGSTDRIVVTEMEHHANLIPCLRDRATNPIPSNRCDLICSKSHVKSYLITTTWINVMNLGIISGCQTFVLRTLVMIQNYFLIKAIELHHLSPKYLIRLLVTGDKFGSTQSARETPKSAMTASACSQEIARLSISNLGACASPA